MAFENWTLDMLARAFYEKMVGGGSSTGGLTDAELRASPVGVDTGLAQALTRAQLDAAPVSVDLVAGDSILTSSMLNRKVAEGKVFFTGKAISAGGALGTARPAFMIQNPATLADGVTANTKTVYVFLISIYSDVSQQIRYREGASLVGSTFLIPKGWNRRLAQHPASVARVAWDDEAPTGGTILSNESRVYNTSPLPLRFETPYEVAPGQSFTLDFQSTATQVTTANGYWYEE